MGVVADVVVLLLVALIRGRGDALELFSESLLQIKGIEFKG